MRAGAVQADHAQEGVEELLARSRRNTDRVIEAVRSEIDDQLARLDLATRDDLERLVQRFGDVAASIVAQVAPDRARPSRSPAARPTKTPAVAAPTAATGSAAKKTAAKKASTKKTAAKKAPAKKTAAKKAPAKKSAAKKTAAAKAPAKTSTGRKSAAKKASGATKSSG